VFHEREQLKMAEKNTASIGFEQQIWAAADILRGNMDAAE
jgi:type I restriction enzyme M protein